MREHDTPGDGIALESTAHPHNQGVNLPRDASKRSIIYEMSPADFEWHQFGALYAVTFGIEDPGDANSEQLQALMRWQLGAGDA